MIVRELFQFVKRTGLKSIFFHAIEIYLGAFLNLFPGPEGLLLRGWFYRFMFIKLGKGAIIYPNVKIIFSHKISVGKGLVINRDAYLDGGGEIELGDHVLIGTNVVIASRGHTYDSVDVPIWHQPFINEKIIIGDDVNIGSNSVIPAGTQIGQGTVIGAGSVVSGKIPPYSIVIGNPARVIANRKKMAAFKARKEKEMSNE